MLVGGSLENKKQSIVLVTEPHTVNNSVTGMPRGTKVVAARLKGTDCRPRAAIVASLDVKLTAMESWCRRDCAVALAKIRGKHTVIVSLYLDINLDVQPGWLDDLMTMIEEKNFPVIIGVDSNAHSALYGPDTNRRGVAFEDFILQYGLNVENIGGKPTYETRRGNKLVQTHIDVTLTRGLTTEIRNWRICSEYNASDHNTILFEILTSKPEPELIRPWSKADWGIFSDYLDKASYGVPQIMSMKKLDKLVDKTYRILQEALDRACPKIKVEVSVKGSHWATEKHDKGKAKVSDLYRKAKKHNSKEAWEAYKHADREFKRICHNDKNKAWRKYKESLQSEQEMAMLAKAAQREEKQDINVLKKEDGSSTDPGKETINLLAKTHFPAATNVKHVTYNNRRNLAVAEISEKYKDWIDPVKIKDSLAGFEKKKSPGPDGIKPLVFDKLTDTFIAVSYTHLTLPTTPYV